ncbi:maleylpyruvate isomerase family mycothiol-dependent enzyme [Micromonospora sp. NPDC049523]|uniref:maleylpyruvate isomerase family mycothiol-dependent enzyme n=1 Tax=Micromonospora sp. NPDC049523 TaxID=3155921 RepID=UPI00344A6C60
MRVYDMIVDERRRAADLLAGLTVDQLRSPSLCAGWTMHDIAAHLVTFLRFGQAKLYLGIAATGADLDRVNVTLTRWYAKRSTDVLIDQLRRDALSRTTIPRSGYDPVLADIVLHDLDIRRPLGIPRILSEERLWVAYQHLAAKPSPGFALGGRLRGLRLVADDAGWDHGTGAAVRGNAEPLVLAMGGRISALDELTGDGVPVLRERLTSATKMRPAQRLGKVLGVLVSPPPPDRRSRDAVGLG